MYHTPQMSQAFLTLINTLSVIKLTDNTHKNDIMDSATNEEVGVTVYFPNNIDPFTRPDGDEKLSYFTVRFGDEEYIDHGFDTVELIALLNSFDRMIAVDGDITPFIDIVKANHNDWDAVISPIISLEVDNSCIVGGGAFATFENLRIS